MAEYFSDRELGPRPRTSEEISLPVWRGLVHLIRGRLDDGSFGYRYPLYCPDGRGVCGSDETDFSAAVEGEIPGMKWPPDLRDTPPTPQILDLLEFCHRVIAKPIPVGYHSYFGHNHFEYDREAGQATFREEVNRIFARNGIAFELGGDGRITRLGPPGLREALKHTLFNTGDSDLDSLLETARQKYFSPDPRVRLESLEKLWDAWERLKTLEKPELGKKASTAALLDRAAPEPVFRGVLEREARELADIGNSFRIRHSEVDKVPVDPGDQTDYLYHRMFSLIRFLLRTTGRGW